MMFSKYVAVITATMIKFLGGPLTGLALQLSWYETAICSAIGMMLTVFIIVFAGQQVGRLSDKFRKPKASKKFTKTTRFAVKIKGSLGLWGIAIMTPLLFTPIGGSVLAVAFKYQPWDIIFKMTVSAVASGVVQSLFFFYVKDLIF
jgi:hypothetical protein